MNPLDQWRPSPDEKCGNCGRGIWHKHGSVLIRGLCWLCRGKANRLKV
jgi:hypothetical protein